MDSIIVGLILVSAAIFMAYRAYCWLVKKQINACCNYCPDTEHCQNRLDQNDHNAGK